MKFNGSSQYVNAGTISQLTGTANASLSMWIFRSSTSTVGGGGAYLEGYRFAIQLWSDGNVYTVAENSGTLGYAYVASTVVGWNHFVLTFDGTQSTTATRQKFYINGVLQSMNYVGVNPTALGNSEFRIGMDYSAGSRYYTNPVDDVRVYNRTLTVQEVKDLYNPGMVLRGTGTTLQGTGTKFNY